MNKPFLKTGYVGVFVIIISLVIMAVNPSKAVKLPKGFYTPVVAFEFIKTEAEVYDLFGHEATAERVEMVKAMKNGTYIDFIYMVAYSIFFLMITLVCRRLTGDRWFIFSSCIILFIFLSDFSENMQLLAIMSKLPSGGFETELTLLNYLTWAKWGGLSCLFISLVPFFRNSAGLGRAIAITSIFSAGTGSAAYLHRSILNEIYFISIAVICIMIIIFTFRYTVNGASDKAL